MSDDFEISREKLSEGIQYCLDNITILLDKSQNACQKLTDNSIALGLYTFAVEEFGKLIILKEAQKENKEKYLIPKDIFKGQKAHKIKFKKAIENLPDECIYPVYGIEVTHNFSDENLEIPVTPSGKEVSVAGGTTGTFDAGQTEPIDIVTRMTSFYLDWDEEKKNWKPKPKVLSEELNKAIKKLGQIVKGMKLSLEHDSKES